MTTLVVMACGIALAILLARILLGGLFQVLFRQARSTGAGSGGAIKSQGRPGPAAARSA